MVVQLRDMFPNELAAFRSYSVNDYANDLIRDQAMCKTASFMQAEQEFDELLPDSFLRVIEHDACAVGVLWYLTEVTDGIRHVFLNDFVISPQHRRKGYGTAALAALEQEAQTHGCTEIRLYASNGNQAVRALYERCGYCLLRPTEAGVYLYRKIG